MRGFFGVCGGSAREGRRGGLVDLVDVVDDVDNPLYPKVLCAARVVQGVYRDLNPPLPPG